MQPGNPNPIPEAHPGGSADASGSAGTAGTALPRGLLSRLSGSFGGGGGAAAQPAVLTDRDLEQPLLPGSAAEEEGYVAHNLERKRWPELRLSSVSTRRLR